MAYRDHIGITSGNKSTTPCVLFCCGMSRLLHRSTSLTVILPIPLGTSDPIREYCPGRRIYAHFRRVSPGENAIPVAVSPLDTDGNLPWSNRDKSTYLTLFPTIVRSSPPVNRQRPAINAVREYAVTADRRSHQGRGPGTVIPVRK